MNILFRIYVVVNTFNRFQIILITLFLLLSVHPGEASDRFARMDSTLSTLHDYGMFNGVVLAAMDDDIVYHRAFGMADFEQEIPNTTETRFKIASITKSFTATLVMRLVESGLLSLDDVITDHLPDYPLVTGSRITLEHLLVQSAGIPDYLELPGFLENEASKKHDKCEFVRYFADLDLDFEPGTDWNYGNSGYYLLGLIVEQVTNMSYDEAMRHYVLEPAGLENSGYAASDTQIDGLATGYVSTPEGYKHAPFFHSSAGFSAGMMYATAEDLFRWVRALYYGKLIQNQQYLQNMITPQIEDYGYGIFVGNQRIGDRSELVLGHAGNIHGFSSQLTYFAFSDYTLIILDNTQQCTARILFTIRDMLFGGKSPPISEPVSGILGRKILDSGIEEAVRYYWELRESRGDECDFSLSEFLRLGNYYLEQDPEIAIHLFELANALYPNTARLIEKLEYAEILAARQLRNANIYSKDETGPEVGDDPGAGTGLEVDRGKLAGDSWDMIRERGYGTLKAIYVPAEGFAYRDEDGRLTGVTVDLIRDFADFASERYDIVLSIEFIEEEYWHKFYRMVADAGDGVIGMGNVTITEERRGELVFSPPYMTNIASLITHKDAPELKRMEDLGEVLAGRTALAFDGTLHEKRLRELTESYYPGAEFQKARSNDEIIELVSSGDHYFAYIDLYNYRRAADRGMALQRHKAGDEAAEQFGYIMPLRTSWEAVVAEYFDHGAGLIHSDRYRKVMEEHLGAHLAGILLDAAVESVE